MRQSRLATVVFTVAVLSLLWPAAAYADAGVPMIFVTYPAMLLALLPVIGIETLVFERKLRLGFFSAGWRVGAANLASTAAGFPLAWGVWTAITMGVAFGLDKLNVSTSLIFDKYTTGRIDLPITLVHFMDVTLFAAWLGPDERNLYWKVPVAAMTGLIPAFFMSVWIEGRILRWLFKSIDAAKVWKLTWKANIISYACLIGIGGLWLMYSIATQSK